MTRSRALVVFHTGEGQSAGIAAAIAADLCAHGGATGTSQDHEYTDGDATHRLADDAAAIIGFRAAAR